MVHLQMEYYAVKGQDYEKLESRDTGSIIQLLLNDNSADS